MKQCKKCGEEKPFSESIKNSQCRNGVTNTCKACAAKRSKFLRDNRSEEERSALNKYKNEWSHKNNNRRKQYLKQKYGMTLEDFEALLLSQGSCCAICRTDDPYQASKVGWMIDHSHENNQVRGILCHTCNLVLGYIETRSLLQFQKRMGTTVTTKLS